MQPDVIGGRYRVERAIGQGGMGTVWLCRDETLQRDVAVKQVGLLPGQSVTDSARALREARSSAALSHRNVVTVFDVVEEHDAIWLVMEHVPSRSLSDIIKQDGPLDPAEVADIGAQVADGLAAAHAAGTMHRDVKPGNVLIREDGVAKISDFGIARTTGDPALTQSGFLTGTPSYFSPELARGATPSPASDVWALGATLYAAVEGRSPYKAQTNPVAVLHEIASQQPSAPRRADFLEPVLLRMMDRDPGSRWSMQDAAHRLHQLAREHSPENTRASTVSIGSQPAPAPLAAETRASETRASETRATESRTAESRAARSAPAATAGTRPDDLPPASPPGRREPTSPAGPDRRRSRRRGMYAALLALVLLLVVGGVAYALSHQGSTGTGTAGGSSSASTGRSSASKSPSSSSSSPLVLLVLPVLPVLPVAQQVGVRHAVLLGRRGTSGGSKAAFVRSYFASAPGGTDQGWSRLGPGEQAQGRASYDPLLARDQLGRREQRPAGRRQRRGRRDPDLPQHQRPDLHRAQALRPDPLQQRRLSHQRGAPDRLRARTPRVFTRAHRPPRVRTPSRPSDTVTATSPSWSVRSTRIPARRSSARVTAAGWP